MKNILLVTVFSLPLLLAGCNNEREVKLFNPDIEKSKSELNDDAKEYLAYIKKIKEQGFDLTEEEVESKNRAKKVVHDYLFRLED